MDKEQLKLLMEYVDLSLQLNAHLMDEDTFKTLIK